MSTRTKNFILGLVTAIIASAIPAIIFVKWLEAIIFLVAHSLIRPQFKREYHNVMPAICREITGVVFFFGISFVLPISISLISAIPINYLIGWIGCTKATSDYYELQCMKLREKYCNEKEQLLYKCRKAKLSERDTKIAVMYFYEHKTPKEIWLWLCDNKNYESIEWSSVSQALWRIGSKLK